MSEHPRAERHRIRHAPRHHRARSRRTATGRAARLRACAPWAAILAITAAFHVYRGVPEDAVIFGAAAAALLLDAVGVLPASTTSRLVSPSAAVPVAAVAGIVLAAAPRYSVVDVITVSAVGLVAIAAAWPDPARKPGTDAPPTPPDGSPASEGDAADPAHAPSPTGRPPTPPVTQRAVLRRTGMLWAAVAVACCLWEVTQYEFGLPSAAADAAHPVISDLLGPLFDSIPGRTIAVAVWFLGGYALLRRGRAR